MGFTPYQEPRCFEWYSLRAFLLRLSNGINCVTAEHLPLFVLVQIVPECIAGIQIVCMAQQ